MESWILSAIGEGKVHAAEEEAARRRLSQVLHADLTSKLDEDELQFVAKALELRVSTCLETEDANDLRKVAADAFQIARVLVSSAVESRRFSRVLEIACLGVLGDRGADVRRILTEVDLSFNELPEDWGSRVKLTTLGIWLRLLRKNGWGDLDRVQECVAQLRKDQERGESGFLAQAEKHGDVQPAWALIAGYHLAKAAELLGVYLVQGEVDGSFDIRQQLEAQFDRAKSAAEKGGLIEQENLSRLLARTAQVLVENSLWSVTRAVNSRVTKFASKLTARDRDNPIFEMLPPQRRALREAGLLGSGERSVVVSLPTSSGKTFIAQFRILQALNQFDEEHGWVAYLAPTRALVNQITQRLRRDFSPLEVVVEKVSPALEVDGIEAGLLTDSDENQQFRVLVTTPEKLDIMIRSGWEEKIGRPLTLVVVDEAHALGVETRGLKLELLLATINRECRHAQFLLLTPFIPNGEELARWLDPDSHRNIAALAVDWSPNDRIVAIAKPVQGARRGDFHIELDTLHTTHNTLEIPETLSLTENRPLGLPWSQVTKNQGKLAAAVAQLLHQRGTVIVLVNQPRHSWGVAEALKIKENKFDSQDGDLLHVLRFLEDEMGADFPLIELIKHGVGVHHGGLSEDTRSLVEWLTEQGKLKTLVATTTIAQGVNFPVSGVVFASHQYPLNRDPFREDMPPEDFWNIAGRVGRVDQGDLGVVALAATNNEKAEVLKEYVSKSVSALNSTLIDMVKQADEKGRLLDLHSLAWQPGWSAFLQYLAHTYRQIGDHERFASEVEQVLRGTLGFQALRKSHQGWAEQLVRGVYNYAGRIQGKSLKLVDLTGFSWESVAGTLSRLHKEGISEDSWSPELFTTRKDHLQRMMGVLLEVPELRGNLQEVTGGGQANGDSLARIVSDWVQGRSLTEMAAEYFDKDGETSTEAMTRCCRNIFGRLTQTTSWGLAALQAMTFGDALDSLPEEEQRQLRNLPAKVYYGVDSDEALTLRILGVPRMAAAPLAKRLGVLSTEPIDIARKKLRDSDFSVWRSAMGNRGESYFRVWSIIEGNG